MCGIVGILNLKGDSVSTNTIKKMTDAIAHRGPNGEGQWAEKNIGIGHRRLSIIDLSSAGHQPMLSNDKRYVLSYNGEIYNFKEIRKELKSLGFIFKSNTDSEVVLNSLIQWGKNALHKFNGMFALAFWDRLEEKLILSRDRYGIKPLYYSKQGDSFIFASEQKSIIAINSFSRKLNKKGLYEYFTFQNFFSEQTLFEELKILSAGYFLTISNRNKEINLTQYWDYKFCESNNKIVYQEYKEELDRLLYQAVSRQLVGDVELGSYLSGGVDSGSISAIASSKINNLKTFTCGFDLSSASGIELNFDERHKAEALAALFKTEHYEIVLKAGDMERSLSKVVSHLEEPRAGQSYPNYFAAKLTSNFVKVVLSGTGGDELFCGYPWRYYRSLNNQNFENYVDTYFNYWQRLLNYEELKKVFSPIWNEVKEVNTRDIFKNVFSTHENQLNSPKDYINHSLYFEAKTFLHSLFIIEDKLSMANSLENRVPFMDNDLVDFALKCPVNFKLKNLEKALEMNENEFSKKLAYFQKTNEGKQILRDAMEKYIPKEVSKASKQGFSSPDASWFRGESVEFIKKRFLNNNALIYNFLDANTIQLLIKEHINGNKNRRLLIWSLLHFDEWLKSFL